MDKVLKFVGLMALLIVTIFFRLFVLGKIYALTVQPQFNLPTIGMWQMFALSWFIGALTFDPETKDNKDTKAVLTRTATVYLGLLISWGLAALIF